MSNKANITNVSQDNLGTLQIPLPPLEIQQQIVAEIEREQVLVNANKELIALFEQKIKDRIAAVWGHADTAEPAPVAKPKPASEPVQYALFEQEQAMVAEA